MSDPPFYNVAVVGGGPAGISVMIKAARIRHLRKLVKKFAIIDSSNHLGKGSLGGYAISSNTHADAFVKAVLGEEPDLEPAESAALGPLHALERSASAKALSDHGAEIVGLSKVGDWLHDVGRTFEKLLSKVPDADCFTSTRVTKIRRFPDSTPEQFTWHLTLETTTADAERPPETKVIHARNVVLACGGRQVVPAALAKVIEPTVMVPSNTILLESQGKKVLADSGLNAGSKATVVIVGGSHSAFSVAQLILDQFPNVTVRIIHRSAIKVFFESSSHAIKAGYTDFVGLSWGGHVHEFAGLRGDAKKLYLDAKKGAQKRIVLVRTSWKNVAQTLETESQREPRPRLTVWAGGYLPNTPPILDTALQPLNVDLSDVDSNTAQPRFKFIAPSASPAPLVPNLFTIGLGFTMFSKNSDGSKDGNAESFGVYCRRQATIVLAGLLGPAVYGGDLKSWKDCNRRNQARKRALLKGSGEESPKNDSSSTVATASAPMKGPELASKSGGILAAPAEVPSEELPSPPKLQRRLLPPSEEPPLDPPPPCGNSLLEQLTAAATTVTSAAKKTDDANRSGNSSNDNNETVSDSQIGGDSSPKGAAELFFANRLTRTTSSVEEERRATETTPDRVACEEEPRSSASSPRDDVEGITLSSDVEMTRRPALPVVKTTTTELKKRAINRQIEGIVAEEKSNKRQEEKVTEERVKKVLFTLKNYCRRRSSILCTWRQTAPLQMWSLVHWSHEFGRVSGLQLSNADLRVHTDVLVDSILSHLGGVKKVVLDNNNGDLFNRGLHGSISAFKKLATLEHLSMSDNFNRVDGSLVHLRTLVHLQHLNFSGCIYISGDLHSLTELSHLAILNLRNCRKVTGNIKDLTKASRLSLLNLRSCINILGDYTDISHLTNLKRLDLSYCVKISGDKRTLRLNLPFCECSLQGTTKQPESELKTKDEEA